MATLEEMVALVQGTDLSQPRPIVEWGVAQESLNGNSVCGDAYLVKDDGARCLIAVVDGLGHGVDAAWAASKAVQTLRLHAGEGLIAQIERCHAALRETRGVVMSLALLNGDDNTLLWAGIGNVEGVLVRKHPHSSPSRERILLRAGVVGYQLLQPRASLVPVSPGDVMVLATDGIYPGFAEEFIDVHSDIQKVASRLLQQYRTQKDDALVLVARYLGTLG